MLEVYLGFLTGGASGSISLVAPHPSVVYTAPPTSMTTLDHAVNDHPGYVSELQHDSMLP